MRHFRLTEAEEKRLGEAIAAEARAMGLTTKQKMPQETKRRVRASVIKSILHERKVLRPQQVFQTETEQEENTYTWHPTVRRQLK